MEIILLKIRCFIITEIYIFVVYINIRLYFNTFKSIKKKNKI